MDPQKQEPETYQRPAGCQCTTEEGDSPCPVHVSPDDGEAFAKEKPMAVVAYIERSGFLLSITRKDTGENSAPGGKREFNETPLEALMREVREEVGVRVVGAIEVFRGLHTSGRLVVAYRCQIEGEPRAIEPGTYVRWVYPEQLAAGFAAEYHGKALVAAGYLPERDGQGRAFLLSKKEEAELKAEAEAPSMDPDLVQEPVDLKARLSSAIQKAWTAPPNGLSSSQQAALAVLAELAVARKEALGESLAGPDGMIEAASDHAALVAAVLWAKGWRAIINGRSLNEKLYDAFQAGARWMRGRMEPFIATDAIEVCEEAWRQRDAAIKEAAEAIAELSKFREITRIAIKGGGVQEAALAEATKEAKALQIERDGLRAFVADLERIESEGPDVGCGDSSCVVASPRGMATNGGCRCGPHKLRMVLRDLRKKVTELEAQIDVWKIAGPAAHWATAKLTGSVARSNDAGKAAQLIMSAHSLSDRALSAWDRYVLEYAANLKEERGANAMSDSDQKEEQSAASQPKDPKPALRTSVAPDLVKKLAQAALKAEDECDSWNALVIFEAGVEAVISELAVLGWEALGIKAGRHEVETGVYHGDYSQEREIAWACNCCGYLSGIENEPCDRSTCATRSLPILAAQAIVLADQAKEIEYVGKPSATMRTVGDDKLLVCDGCSKIVTEPHRWIDCCNTLLSSVASYERMIQQERDACRDDVARNHAAEQERMKVLNQRDAANVEITRLKAEVEAKARRVRILEIAPRAAHWANTTQKGKAEERDAEYAADVIERGRGTNNWERGVLEYVAIEDAQKKGRT